MSFTYSKIIIGAKTDPCGTSFYISLHLIFHFLLLFLFPFLSGSLPSSSLMFLLIFQCVPTSIVISCAEPYLMPFYKSKYMQSSHSSLSCVISITPEKKPNSFVTHDLVLNLNCLFVIIRDESKLVHSGTPYQEEVYSRYAGICF